MATNKKKLLTKKSYDELLHELEDIKNNQLPKVLEQIKEAREAWDLSENSEYHSAKEKQVLLQVRIRQIEEMLDWVEIVDEWQWDEHIVWYWSNVLLELDDWKQYEVTLVWSWEVKLWDTLKISFNSPIWSAIEWKKEWDTVKVKLPGWRIWHVKILKIS